MSVDSLQSLQIFTKLGVDVGRGQLHVLAIDNILLSVEEPVRNFVMTRVRDDRDNLLYLLIRTLAGTFERVDISFLQHDVGIAATDTLDRSQRDWHRTLSVNVSAEHTKDVLELLWNHERLK
uniref:Uncharacterized protein n=1 Tax=Anopheles christyi TaxID=43041 RepID=A0A182KI89_9DIPT